MAEPLRLLRLVTERRGNDARNFAVGALLGAAIVLLIAAISRPSACSPN